MQNSPEVEFNKFIFQNLLKYVPEHLVNKVPANGNGIDNNDLLNNSTLASAKFWHAHKPSLVKRLWPIAVLIGLLEVVAGLLALMFVGIYHRDYDKIYNTEISKVTSNASFIGCVALIASGFMLLFSLLLENQRYIKLYIFISVIVCVYIFMLACMKIHFALLAIERDTYNVVRDASKHSIFLSTACVIGIATLLGSVIHFIGAVTVFTYYNLKYLHSVC